MTKWPEFDSMMQLQGRAYLEVRDQILGSGALAQEILQGAADGDSWEVRVHREILRGWQLHRDLYKRVQGELNGVDVEFERKKITGVSGVWTRFSSKAAREYGEPVLPACWEAILKLRNFLPDWQVLTYLHMISALPKAESVEPLIEYLYRTPEAAVADLAGRILEVMPREAAIRGVDGRLATTAEAGVQDGPPRAILVRTKERLLKK